MRSASRNVATQCLVSIGILTVLGLAPLQGACKLNTIKKPDGGSADAGDAAMMQAPDADNDAGSSDAAVAAAFGFTPSNFDLSALDLTDLGDVDITGSSCYINSEMEDSACFSSSAVKFTVITQPNQVKVGIYAAHSWRIEPNANLSVTGSFPIILVATDKIEILGSLDAAAMADVPVAGGYTQTKWATKGNGPGGGGAGSATAAGGGGSYCGIGGSGGIVSGTAPAGGTAYGTPEIIPLAGGSQGGGGVETNGGAGGGAIQLVAANSVSILGEASVSVGGGHGNWSGGGGGSGGVLLIEAETVTVAGTLAANGGGGQGGPGGISAGDAMSNDQPAPGSTSYDSGAAGGKGSAGASVDGSNGGDGSDTIVPGGGGGGAGRIRFNTKSGSATLTGATLSPDMTTSCLTQGKVKP